MHGHWIIAHMRGFESSEFRIEPRWKEEVIYWEGGLGYLFDAGWGVDPPVLYVPSAEMWNEVVPDWMQGRRDTIVDRLVANSGHVVEEDVHGYYRNEPEGRVLQSN
jgi:hypothetical protein